MTVTATVSSGNLGQAALFAKPVPWASVQMVSAGTNKLRLHSLLFCTNLKNTSRNGLSAAEESADSGPVHISPYKKVTF